MFLWLPKCAGTSVASLCWEHDLLIDLLNVEELHVDRYVDANEYPNAYTFGFVRNPWDRVVSSYAMFAGDRRPAAIPAPSFRAFLDIVEHEPLAKRPYEVEVWDLPERADELSIDELAACYRRSIKNHTATFIDPFYKLFDHRGAQRASFIGRYERFEADAVEVFRVLGVPIVEVPHLNAGERSEYARYYDDETRVLVARLFGEEIEIFGYSFA